jgi:hypothetical protein
MRQVRKEVEAGMKSARGPKDYNVFAMKEFRTFVNLNIHRALIFHLKDRKLSSVALKSAGLER